MKIPNSMLDRYGYLKDRYIALLLVGGFVAASLFFAYALVFPIDRRDCRIAAEGQGVERKYVNFSGCYLKTGDGKFVPKSQFRAVIR